MGNSKQFGAFGLLRKSVGSVTYSKGKDGKGKTIQIVRAKATDVANPNTVNQILQRAKIKPAQRFYEAMNTILDHSWQGIEYGNASRIHFMSKALKLSGPYIPKSVDKVVPVDYPVSEGNLASVLVQPTAISESTAIASVALTADMVSALIAANVPQGAQLTIIAWYQDGAGNYKYAYGRLINDIDNLFAWTGSTAANMAVGVKTGRIAVTTVNGLAPVAVCGIVSQLNNGTWERSTQSMVLTESYKEGLYNQTAKMLTVQSYQEQTNGNAINSAWYLNLANGQPFPGQLDVSEEAVADGVYANVISGWVLGVPGYKNGDLMIFTDDGTTTGKVKLVSNGEIIDGTAAQTAYLLDGFCDQVALWVDTYATQLGF